MDLAQAEDLIESDRRNRDVLFPYLSGQDLNSDPGCSASRWVVDFREESESVARAYYDVWQWVQSRVKPERETKDAAKYPRMVKEWWKHWNSRVSLYAAIKHLDRVIVIARLSKTVMPVVVHARQVMSEQVVVFASDDSGMLAMLSSNVHYWWAISRASTMKGDLRYPPTDVFETLPRPEVTAEMREHGDRLDFFRRDLMQSRRAGLTATYNLVHDRECTDADIAGLREIHRAIDEAVVHAYGWDDLFAAGLDYGFHETRQGQRYTIGAAVRQEILDRLLELNHERYEAEVRAGLHIKRGKNRTTSGTGDTTLF